ncbi:MAG: AMP-binding protein [Luteolibacter sp.]
MDAALLTNPDFWNDSAVFSFGKFPGGFPDADRLLDHVLFETSGSSGTPKWVALSKPALLASAAAVNRHLQVTAESCWGLALPLHHVGGFGVCARAFEAGGRLEVFGKRWETKAFSEWLHASQVTHTSLVPTQVHDLVKAGTNAPQSLQAIVVGGGHLDMTTGEAARDLGWPVLASYGMTEAASQIATQTLDQLANPYQPAPIPLLPIWRADVSPDDLLRISGPALFSGYVISENGVWRFIPRESEWHVTSDRVMLDNSTITPLGRADTLVKVLGELVDPESIERELTALSDGRLAAGTFAVIALPDQRAGHVLVPVFETLIDRSVVQTALALYQITAPGFGRLHGPAFVPEIPRSPLGKLLRKELAAECAKHGFA